MGKILDEERKTAERRVRFLRSDLLQSTFCAQFDRLRSAIGKCSINLQQVNFSESYGNDSAYLTGQVTYETKKEWGQMSSTITDFDIDKVYDMYLNMASRTRHMKDFAWAIGYDVTSLVGEYNNKKTVIFEEEEIDIRAKFKFSMPIPNDVYILLQNLGKIVTEHYSSSNSSIRTTC